MADLNPAKFGTGQNLVGAEDDLDIARERAANLEREKAMARAQKKRGQPTGVSPVPELNAPPETTSADLGHGEIGDVSAPGGEKRAGEEEAPDEEGGAGEGGGAGGAKAADQRAGTAQRQASRWGPQVASKNYQKKLQPRLAQIRSKIQKTQAEISTIDQKIAPLEKKTKKLSFGNTVRSCCLSCALTCIPVAGWIANILLRIRMIKQRAEAIKARAEKIKFEIEKRRKQAELTKEKNEQKKIQKQMQKQ